jgi:hypothetical protein
MRPIIPSITKRDLHDEQRCAELAADLHALEFFWTLLEAKAFISSLRKHRALALEREPWSASALSEEFIGILNNSFDRVHSAYDGATGRLRSAVVQEAKEHDLPFQLYDAALHRVQSGQARTYGEALAAVCAENRAPLPQRLRAFEQLSQVEPELLAAEARAAEALAEARGKLIAARSTAVGIINQRDHLVDKLAQLRAELHELQSKRDLVTKRRERSAAHVVRTLRPGATLMLHTIADLGASVFGFDIALAELARLIPEKEVEVTAAEKALADFLAQNGEALSPV